MKFYIPTSTLNVSNILSSGSISPIKFYGERHFGIGFFEPIKETSNCRDAIILFDRYPIFNIVSNKESYPMVLELELPKESLEQTNIEGVYCSHKTIYINPVQTRFYFNTIDDERSALSRIEQSDEAKFFALYKNSFGLSNSIENKFELTELTIKSIVLAEISNIETEISLDLKRDRLSGALCGYYLGANGFEDVYGDAYSKRSWLKDAISKIINIFSGDGKEDLSNKMRSVQEEVIKQYAKRVIPLADICTLASDYTLSINYTKDSDLHKCFFEKIWNWVIEARDLTQNEVSKHGGVSLKEISGKGWSDSEDRRYFMQLLNNVTNYDDFNIDSSDSIILKSFAAFVQRGCLGDWDKLCDYLDEKNHSIPDRRFIYGLFGGYIGFSTLSKTFTDTSNISSDELRKLVCDINESFDKKHTKTPVKNKNVTVKEQPLGSSIDVTKNDFSESNPNEDAIPSGVSHDINTFEDLFNNSGASQADKKILSLNKLKIIECGEDYGKINNILSGLCKESSRLMKYIEKKINGIPVTKTKSRQTFVDKTETYLFSQKYINIIHQVCKLMDIPNETKEKIIHNFNFAYKKDVIENGKTIKDAIRYTYNLCFSPKTPEKFRLTDVPINRNLLEEIRNQLNETSDE